MLMFLQKASCLQKVKNMIYYLMKGRDFMFFKKIMTTVLAAALVVSVLTGEAVSAEDSEIVTGYCGESVKWSLDRSIGVLTISGMGDMYSYSKAESWGYHRYRDEIKDVVIEEGITSIGGRAFYQTPLTGDLILPKSLKKIGTYAFFLTNITSVNLHEEMSLGGKSFSQCNYIKEVTIPNDLDFLDTPTSNAPRENAAFCNCESLEKVIIKGGGTVTAGYNYYVENAIAGHLFSYCTSLKEIIIDCENIEYLAPVVWLTDEQQESGTFWIENHPTFYIYKDSTTEETLKRTGYFRNANIQYIAEFSALETAIEKAEGIETDKYTDESVSAFNEVLKNGKVILEDLTSTQEEVDSAVKALNSAIKALEVKKDEPTSSEPTGNSSEPTKPSSSSSTAKPTTAVPKVVTPNPTFTKVVKPAKVKKVKVTAKKKKLKVSWKKVSGATGYEVQYATNNKFTKGKKTVTVKKNKVTLKKLKPKKKYFVKVRAYKLANGRKYFGKWSKVVKKKVK